MANMKKLLLILALLLPVTAMAQTHWTAMTNQELNGGETVIYATLYINGAKVTANDNLELELAAFINDECRADATAHNNGVYTLRVVGTNEEVTSQPTITFRAFYGGTEYQFTVTSNYQGDNTTGAPSASSVTLNLDVVTGVKFTQDLITISKRLSQNPLPWTEDLSSYIQFLYGNNENYTPSEESSVVGGTGASDYAWSTNTPADISDQISFDGTNVTFKQLGTYNGITLTVTYNGSRLTTGTVTLEATAANVPVESISCSVETAE